MKCFNLMLFAFVSLFALGCEVSSKTGGGGHSQPYDHSSGRYTREMMTVAGVVLTGLVLATRRRILKFGEGGQHMVRVLVLTTITVVAQVNVATAGDTLPSGATLKPGERLVSANGHFTLVMQAEDGNLVLYQGSTPLWWSGTNSSPGAWCSMQANDGNLVVYGNHQALWNSETKEHAGAHLVCKNDGNLVIIHQGKEVWSSGTSERGEALLKIAVAFKLIIGPAKPPQPPNPPPQPQPPPKPPKAGPKAPAPKPLTAPPPTASSWRVVRYGKWGLKWGGRVVIKAVPYVGWAMLAYDGAELLYSGGQWLYQEVNEGSDKQDPNKGVIAATAEEPAEWEAITPISTGADTVALLFHTGFLCADVGTGEVIANRQQIEEWEKFRVTKDEDGKISLLALATGKYLSAVSGGGAGVTADAEKVGPWEKFTPEVIGDKLYLKADRGQYLSARKP